ncbi:hypothetical protein BC941DRAFT_7356 [Chlamydoabsidia padenii]|nr:hypothetical protein BC941DRAFT_7356 [Chlamydoabsidia padenii]
MQTLIASAILLDKLQVVLVEVYREYTMLLKLEHFVSLALVQLGISARLYTLAHKWVNELADCYQLIQKLHQAYPYGSKKTGCLYRCDPTTMKDERVKAEQWIKNRLSFKSPVHFEFFLTHLAEDNNNIQEKDDSMESGVTTGDGDGDDDLGGRSDGIDGYNGSLI